ncbi:hypothetical protein [Kiloniella sp.]|uniref:hypothetical protein n=1 Tax=Kiloniella sp. TaxID=1938587 RepID=UPI003B02963E
MGIFLITHHGSQKAELTQAIETKFPDDHFKVSTMTWLVSFEGTAESLSRDLGIVSDDGSNIGRTMVTGVSSYYGVEPVDVWEWIRVNWPGGPHGR